MMATRKPKVAPSRPKEHGSSSSEEIEMKNQAWTDTESQSGSERPTSSLISVREADETIDNTTFIGVDVGSTHETFLSDSTKNGLSNDGDVESMTTDSQKQSKIKRNTVVPTDKDLSESGRGTPESRKDAWEDTTLIPSRPSTAPVPEAEQSSSVGMKRCVTVSTAEAITERPVSPSSINKGFVHDTSKDIDGKSESSGSQISLLRNPFSRKTTVKPFVADPGINEDIITSQNEPEPVINADNDERTISSASSGVLALPRAQGEQSAFIPLCYAKDCIQKVIDDMKRMKGTHLKIIDQIQDQYKMIEEDSQGQFNQFVITIRDQYESKVSTFRQVIEVHRTDLENNQNYWKSSLDSLKEKNKILLQEKRKLLLKNKEEFANLEQEKIVVIKNLTNMLDEKHIGYLAVKKELVGKIERISVIEKELEGIREKYGKNDVKHSEELEKYKTTFDDELNVVQRKHEGEMSEMQTKLESVEKENKVTREILERHKGEVKEKTELEVKESENENKILKKENEDLKNEIESLKKQEGKVVAVTAATVVEAKEIEKQQQQEAKLGVSISNEELTRLNTEMLTHKEKAQSLDEEVTKYKEKIQNMEEDMNASVLEKEKYENHLATTKQDLAQSRQRSEALHRQLEGLLATVSVDKDNKETETTLKKAVEDKTELMVEVEKLKNEVDEWKERFENENKEPSEDVSDEYQKLVERLAGEEEKVRKNENTIAVMTMLKEGSIPETLPGGGLSKELGDLEEKFSNVEDERNQLALDLEKLKCAHGDTEMKLKESDEKNQELESDLENVRQELIDAANMKTSSTQAENIEELSGQLSEMKQEFDRARVELDNEKKQNNASFEELEKLKNELSNMKQGSDGEVDELKAKIISTKKALQGEINVREEQLAKANERIAELEKQLRDNLPVDVGKELESCQAKVNAAQVEKVAITKDMLQLQATNTELLAKIDHLNKSIETNKKTKKEIQENNKKARDEMENKLKTHANQAETKHKKMVDEHNKKIKSLQHRIKELESAPQRVSHAPAVSRKDSKSEEKLHKEKEKLQSQIEALKKVSMEDQQKIKQLEKDVKEAKAKPAGGAEDRIAAKKAEKQIKDLTKQLEMEKKKNEKNKENQTKSEEEFKELKKSYDSLSVESKSDKTELAKLGVAAKEGLEAQEKLHEVQSEVKKLHEENKTLTENYNSERILRKKYYNMVEDMKGKIRVYCRSRPLSRSELERGNHYVIKSPDEYSISVQTARGPKEFQFDQIFTEESTQEKVFEDTYNLVQSAVDGYNVCIFAYGQTGSGKTFTMIGDRDKAFPGIAPRAMDRIFALLNENKSKFSFSVSVYMMELYNDRLIDLLSDTPGSDAKMEIKKDKKGLVFVHGAKIMEASTSENLYDIFEKGSQNRHTASTKMNAESSRSHLILSIIIETTNKTTGAVLKGKLSLVDLAGSERAAKTEASAEQLKEAQSINKSLSALGDVISALSSEQSFIPYRNNKLTMLMQDSLGGNAKTLMFVNISPADYNTDETVTSLTYASRVKLITNDATKNSENKEIVRLKAMIAKLKQGESVEDEDGA